MMFSPTVIEENSAPPWKATPVFLCSSCFSWLVKAAVSWPNILMVPDVRRSRPMRWRKSVLLPDPLPPMMIMISPSLTSRLTPSRMMRSP